MVPIHARGEDCVLLRFVRFGPGQWGLVPVTPHGRDRRLFLRVG
jgi:hypothetical protein